VSNLSFHPIIVSYFFLIWISILLRQQIYRCMEILRCIQYFAVCQTNISEMLNIECIVYLWICINISCMFKNNTENHLKFDQQLLGLTLRVNPWLWNPAHSVQYQQHLTKLSNHVKGLVLLYSIIWYEYNSQTDIYGSRLYWQKVQ